MYKGLLEIVYHAHSTRGWLLGVSWDTGVHFRLRI